MLIYYPFYVFLLFIIHFMYFYPDVSVVEVRIYLDVLYYFVSLQRRLKLAEGWMAKSIWKQVSSHLALSMKITPNDIWNIFSRFHVINLTKIISTVCYESILLTYLPSLVSRSVSVGKYILVRLNSLVVRVPISFLVDYEYRRVYFSFMIGVGGLFENISLKCSTYPGDMVNLSYHLSSLLDINA